MNAPKIRPRRHARRGSALTALCASILLSTLGSDHLAQASGDSLGYLGSDFSGTGTWSPAFGPGSATVAGSPAYGSAFGIKIDDDDDSSYPIKISHNDINNLSTTEARTIQMWVNLSKLPASGFSNLFLKFVEPSYDGYYVAVASGGGIRLTTNGQWQVFNDLPAGQLTPGQWHLITIVAQIGSVRKIYVDNTLVHTSQHVPDSVYSNDAPVWVGGFEGCVGGFRAYTGELSASQISDVRSQFASSPVTGPCLATVNVSFDGNGNTAGTPPDPSSATTYQPYAVPSIGTLSRAGYRFVGWNSRADGSGTNYRAGSTIPWDTGIDTTLYAKWAPITAGFDFEIEPEVGAEDSLLPSTGTSSWGLLLLSIGFLTSGALVIATRRRTLR